MFDIFSEEKPCLYIADITIKASIPVNIKSKKIDSRIISLKKYPIVLLNGEKFPTEKTKRDFLHKIFLRYILKGDFERVVFKIEKIENIKFSSKLMYDFNFNIH
jgi:hypothetical protein